jgi:hypothetical protein
VQVTSQAQAFAQSIAPQAFAPVHVTVQRPVLHVIAPHAAPAAQVMSQL